MYNEVRILDLESNYKFYYFIKWFDIYSNKRKFLKITMKTRYFLLNYC